MIKSLKKNKTSYLRNKVVNTLMKSGKKKNWRKNFIEICKVASKIDR
jgi:hypothetical protein